MSSEQVFTSQGGAHLHSPTPAHSPKRESPVGQSTRDRDPTSAHHLLHSVARQKGIKGAGSPTGSPHSQAQGKRRWSTPGFKSCHFLQVPQFGQLSNGDDNSSLFESAQSVDFNIFTELCSHHHYLILEHFHQPKMKPHTQ